MDISHDPDEMTYEEALQHYGVLGMKWGVRRSQAELRRAGKKRRAAKTAETLKNQSKPGSRRNTKILDARDKRDDYSSDVRKAKNQYRAVKKKPREDAGRFAAREALRDARHIRNHNAALAREKTTGEQVAEAVLDYVEKMPSRANEDWLTKQMREHQVMSSVDEFQRRNRKPND